jgi:hypothetical protein
MHALIVEAARVLEYVPGEHCKHDPLSIIAGFSLYVPAGHERHAALEEAPESGEYVPIGQGVQLDVAPMPDEYVATSHMEQADMLA